MYFLSGTTKGRGCLLLGRVLDKVDALLNVALETANTRLQQLLLLLGDVANGVDGLFRTVGLFRGLARELWTRDRTSE